MKVAWAILCKNTIVNRDTNNVTLVEVVEEVNVAAAPPKETSVPELGFSNLLDLHLVSLWTRDDPSIPEACQIRIRALSPEGKALVSAEAEVDLTEVPRMRGDGHLLELPFPFTEEGIYYFNIQAKTADSDWKEVYELPLWVNVYDEFPSNL